jgi:hypothetical protein
VESVELMRLWVGWVSEDVVEAGVSTRLCLEAVCAETWVDSEERESSPFSLSFPPPLPLRGVSGYSESLSRWNDADTRFILSSCRARYAPLRSLAQSSMGTYGYAGLVNLGSIPITVGSKTASHPVMLSEETNFDCVLGRSWMEKMGIK